MLDTLTSTLEPVIEAFEGLDLAKPAEATAAIEARVPYDGPVVASIRAAAEAAFEAGLLTPKENGDLKFGRVAKDVGGYSVDAVCMHLSLIHISEPTRPY